jgi:tight adherence protein C
MTFSYTALRFAVLGASGLSLSFLTYALVGAPTRVASRLGMRGLKRRRAIENNPAWAQIEPLVRWFGVRVSGWLSDDMRDTLDKQLRLAGDWMGLTPEEYVGLSIVGMLGGLIFGAVFGVLIGANTLMIGICGPLFASLPYFQISSEAERRLKQINRGLPMAIDLMALAMSAGLDFPGAIRQVVEKSSDATDALVEELQRILQELQLGRTRRQALVDFGERVPSEQVNEFVNAIIQAEERGNPVAEVLLIQAGVSRQRRSVRAEELAARAGVAMVGPLFLLFGCIMLLVVAPMIMKLAAAQ